MNRGISIYAAEQDNLTYEWNEFVLYKNAEGEYYVDEQGGCSCCSYDIELIKWETAKPMTPPEVLKAFLDWASFMQPLNKTRELEGLYHALQWK